MIKKLIDKDALVSEIERLVNNYDKALDYEAALEDVRDFIDSLEVKESAEFHHVNETCKENGDSLTQEPVNDELEKAAVEAFKQIVDSNKNNFLEIFKAGAKWQETKDKQILNEEGVVILPEEEFERMKRSLIKLAEREQQMMANAFDGVVTFDYYEGDKAYGCVAHDSFCLEDLGLKDMDEVKILILKK